MRMKSNSYMAHCAILKRLCVLQNISCSDISIISFPVQQPNRRGKRPTGEEKTSIRENRRDQMKKCSY